MTKSTRRRRLGRIVGLMRRGRGELSEPALAFGRCHDASMEFAEMAIAAGLGDVGLVELVGRREALPRGCLGWRDAGSGRRVDRRMIVHYACMVDGAVYDWTARQFDPSAAFPAVATTRGLRREWRGVTVIRLDDKGMAVPRPGYLSSDYDGPPARLGAAMTAEEGRKRRRERGRRRWFPVYIPGGENLVAGRSRYTSWKTAKRKRGRG